MDSQFLPSRHLSISYQYGLDGSPRQLIIPRWAMFAVAAFLLLMLLSGLAFPLFLSGYSSQASRLKVLESENNSLRTKVEFYSTAVDSIYKMIGTVQALPDSSSRDFPSLSFSAKPERTDFAYDPALRTQIDNLELKLSYILGHLPKDTLISQITPAELVVGDIPADTMPSIYPTFGRISDAWGLRVHPITNTIEFHQGIDIANQMGTPIYATAAGTVTVLDFDPGYGKRIKISHSGGYETLYAHLYSYMVRIGEPVTKGQIIGLMGSTGVSTGPHLHYEVHNSAGKVNPTAFLNRIDEPSYASR